MYKDQIFPQVLGSICDQSTGHLLFVGESYRSLLLKADMGAANRERLSDLALPEIETFDDRNFSVPVSNLQKVELIHESRTKRTSLRFIWGDREMRFYDVTQNSSGSDAIDNVTRLTEDGPYENVTVTVSEHRFDPFSRGRRAVSSLLSRFA